MPETDPTAAAPAGGAQGDGVSAMAAAGFCRVCGQHVWLTTTGGGVCGHPPAEISGHYEAEPPETGSTFAEEPVAQTPAIEAVPLAAPAPMELPPPEPARRKRRTGLIVGLAAAAVVLAALAAVFFQRPTFVVTAMRVPDGIVQGEEAAVELDVANEGWFGGETELIVTLDGEDAETLVVRLGAGENDTFEVPISTRRIPGHYKLGVAGWEELGGDFWVMKPASFEIADVWVSPEWLDFAKEKAATVYVSVANVGEAGGNETLRVELDGAVIEERDVYVDGGYEVEEAFAITVSQPGPCEISVNGVCVDLEVYNLARPANGTVLVNSLKGGANQIKIVNNDSRDVVLILAAPGEGQPALVAVYVHAGATFTLKGVKSGTYTYYYQEGTDWCTHRKAFTSDSSYGRFEQNSTLTSSGRSYTVSTVTFGLTSGEGSATESVPEASFPPL